MYKSDYNIRAAVYARYSSDKQTELSIEAQLRACRDYAINENIEIVNEYIDEAVSGSTNKRAAYQRMIRDAKREKFDVILIHKYDRIARNLGEHVNLTAKLEDLGISIIAVAQNFGNGKEGKLMRSIQWILSEYYLDNLAEEVRKGHKEIALKGLHNGGRPPFGYDILEQRYVINETEAEYVRKMFDAASHLRGYGDIIKEMNEKGITGKQGKPIRRSSITEILHNEKYTGVYLYSMKENKNRSERRTKPNAIRVEGAIPAIISKEQFEEVQKIMETRKNKAHQKHRLGGLIRCGCGSKMYFHTSKRKGHEYYYFTCNEHCGNNVPVESVEAAVENYLKIILQPENVEALTRAINRYNADEAKMRREFEAERTAKLTEKQSEIDTLTANMTSISMSPVLMAEIGGKLEKLIKERDKIRELQPVKKYSSQIVTKWLEKVSGASSEEIPSVLIERIEITKGQNETDPEIEIISTLSESVEMYGCGDMQPYIPTIFISWKSVLRIH